MSRKVKSTIIFVKVSTEKNTRDEIPMVIISPDIDTAKIDVSSIISTWVETVISPSGKIVEQCYLKSVEHEIIYQALRYVPKVGDIGMNDSEILDYIINNKVRLIPSPTKWVDENGETVDYVTHDVSFGEVCYQGMSVKDCVLSYINQ